MQGVLCVDLDESFQTHIYLQNVASIQPRKGPLKFALVGQQVDETSTEVFDLVRRVHDGEGIYIHCWGGRGRTGIVAACLLGLLYDGMDAEEALDRVQAYFATRAPGNPSPETEPQRQQVRDFYYAGYNEARPG